jgi:hypothetical protein
MVTYYTLAAWIATSSPDQNGTVDRLLALIDEYLVAVHVSGSIKKDAEGLFPVTPKAERVTQGSNSDTSRTLTSISFRQYKRIHYPFYEG